MLLSKRVLVLEDEPIVAFLLEDMLSDLGAAEVAMTSRVADALAAVRADRIHAAVLDVNVHGQLSYPVADELAARRIPYIFATGYGDRQHPERHRAAPTLTKPFSAQDLGAALDAALGGLA